MVVAGDADGRPPQQPEDGGGDEEVSTVLIGGLPHDATPRELDNFCRFMPGFVNSKVDTKKGIMLFVRFDTAQNATMAIELIGGQVFDRSNPGEVLRATMARSNMRKVDAPSVGGGGGYTVGRPGPTAVHVAWSPRQPPPPPSQPPPSHGPPSWIQPESWSQSSKRPRIAEDPSAVDTVAVIGAHEAGFDEQTLEGFFQSLAGFVAFKHNKRIGGGFAKFTSSQLAAEAVVAASDSGVPASMAKSSMGVVKQEGGAPLVQHAYAAGQPPPPAGLPPASVVRTPRQVPPPVDKRGRPAENPTNVDTVACVGALEAGFDEAALQAFFSTQQGYLAFKANPRMGGGFIKFSSASLAAEAVTSAQIEGIPAAIARSSMSNVTNVT